MSRGTFHLFMWLICIAFIAIIVFAFALPYPLMGVIEPELMFEEYEWRSFNHNESYCRHKKENGFGRNGRDSPPRSFSDEVTRERLTARRVAREKVREEHVPVAEFAGLGLLTGSAFYAFLLWRLLGCYRPRPDAPPRANSKPFRFYLSCILVLGYIGCIGCTVGVAYGAVVIYRPDIRASDWDLERGKIDEEYWSWIGQGLNRDGPVDIHKRPPKEELARARMGYLEVVREQQRDFGRLVVGVAFAGWLMFAVVTILHWQLIQLLRSWRTSAAMEEAISENNRR